MKNALKLGGAIALVGIIIALITLNIWDFETMLNWKFLLISTLISFTITVFLGRYFLRPKDYVGLSYGEALKYIFLAFLVSSLISQVFSIVMYGDNEEMEAAFVEYSHETQISAVRTGMKFGGAKESAIEIEVDKLKDQIESGEIPPPDYPYTWARLPMNILVGGAIGLLVSLLAAIFVKQPG